MKHKKCYLIVAVMILLFSGAASTQIEVSPSTIELDLVGGDTVTRQINITWTGEDTIVGFITTNITPDGDGFTITYSENPISLIPNTPKTLDMTISVAINIKPDNYTIDTNVLTNINEIIKYEYKTIYEYITRVDHSRINELLILIQQLQDELNQTTNCSEYLATIDELSDAIEELQDTINELLSKEPEEEEYDWSLVIVILSLMLVLCFSGIYCILRDRRIRKQKKEK